MRYNDHAMILLADFPVLAGLAKQRTAACRLDVRACKAIYRDGLCTVANYSLETLMKRGVIVSTLK